MKKAPSLEEVSVPLGRIKKSASYYSFHGIDRVLVCFDTLPIYIRAKTEEEGGGFECAWTDFGGFGVFIDSLTDENTGAETKQLIYVGQLSAVIEKEDQENVRALLSNLTPRCIPVFTDPEARNAHYQTFCKRILWPLFHNCLDTNNAELSTNEKQEAWSSYSNINMEFARTIVENFHRGDIIWIQDYHLLLLPSYLTRKIPAGQATVGLFIHTPFPSAEIMRTFPWREEILRGMVNVDHLGFHLYEYARHFMTGTMKILGIDKEIRKNGQLGLEVDGKRVMITCTMLATDIPRLVSAVQDDKTMEEATKHVCNLVNLTESQMKENIIVASVDTVEKLKGIPLKLLAIENLLKNQPSMIEKFIMIQIGLTFDVSSDSKAQLTKEIQEITDRINSHFQRVDLVPIVIYKEVPVLGYCERLALWKYTRVFLNTSIRDGLNMMPAEYISTRVALGQDKSSSKKDDPSSVGIGRFASTSLSTDLSHGVAIISEFSGASRPLSGALKVNPWRISACTQTIEKAMRMHLHEQAARLEQDAVALYNNVSKSWVTRVLSDVKDSGKDRVVEDSSMYSVGLGFGVRKVAFHAGFKKLEMKADFTTAYKKSKKRLILLDSRGTLFPSTKFALAARKQFRPNLSSGRLHSNSNSSSPQSSPTKISSKKKNTSVVLPKTLISDLEELGSDPNNIIFIIAGSIRSEVFSQFGSFKNINFAAEHGFYVNWSHKRDVVGGQDPDGNSGWELLGGNKIPLTPFNSSPCVINFVNESGSGVWMRLLRSSGGFHGIDLPKETTSLMIETHHDVVAIAYMFWNKGEDESWNPVDVIPAENGCVVSFKVIDGQMTCGTCSAPFLSNDHDIQRRQLSSNLVEYVSESWISITKSIMEDFKERTTGSFIEQRDSSILWRFRDTDPDFGDLQSKELSATLSGTLKSFPVDVLSGKDYVEVRPEGVNKGAVAQFIISTMPDVEFILSIGDDSADETMFSSVESHKDSLGIPAYTVTVGKKPSAAAYYLDDYKEVNEVLSCLAAIKRFASVPSASEIVTKRGRRGSASDAPGDSKDSSGSSSASPSTSPLTGHEVITARSKPLPGQWNQIKKNFDAKVKAAKSSESKEEESSGASNSPLASSETPKSSRRRSLLEVGDEGKNISVSFPREKKQMSLLQTAITYVKSSKVLVAVIVVLLIYLSRRPSRR